MSGRPVTRQGAAGAAPRRRCERLKRQDKETEMAEHRTKVRVGPRAAAVTGVVGVLIAVVLLIAFA